ncbi:hypothetical protein ACI2KT_30715 [Ensifer adhaerens]|uniref:hypothetical protein n=1 Tax=Ensifer adhaerens TaxID=106592 RepID=UPI00384F8B67
MVNTDPPLANGADGSLPAIEPCRAAEIGPNQAESAAAPQKTTLFPPREWRSSITLALIGLSLIVGCTYALIGVFAEGPVKSKSLVVTNSPSCRPPNDVGLSFHVVDGGKLTASLFPFYPEDGSQDPRCVRIASDEPISLPANPMDVWGDANLSKPPLVEQLHLDSTTEMWITEAYFPVPPKQVDGVHTFPRNKALTVSFQHGLSRPTYTRAAMKMIVSFVPLLGPKRLLIVLDEHMELKSFDATTDDYKVRGRNIDVSVSRGLASFQLIVTDLRRERSKEITLLVAGGLLMLGLGCLVDLIMKLLELRARSGGRSTTSVQPTN